MPRLVYILLLIVALLIPLVTHNRYYIDILAVVGLYIMLGLGLNIVIGCAGLLDLGYVAFYAIGAYVSALLTRDAGLSFWMALPVAALCATLSGVLLGIPVLRLRGDYLAMVTLGFGEIIRIILNNLELTGGPNGLMSIPRPSLLGFKIAEPKQFYYLILAFCLLTIWGVGRLDNSRLGRAWAYIREDELAAEMTGISVMQTKLFAFALGATWSGFAGAIFAAKMAFLAPESFTWMESSIIMCIVVLGGMGSIPGVTVGAAAMITLPEAMREFAQYRMLAVGVGLILMMHLRPQGLIPRRPYRRVAVMPDAIRTTSAALGRGSAPAR